MATRGERPITWRPRGTCDTVDGSAVPIGAMTSLQNLLPDPSTPNCFVCRPANTMLIDFTAWAAAVPAGAAGVVTAAYQVGDIIYGLVGITSGVFSGLDYPFAYDTVGQVFLAIAAVVAADCPTSQATTGVWVPPQMTLTGIDLVVTHVGFPGGAGAFFGWFDVTTPMSPTWNVGNTSTNALPSVPQACGTFNNRTRFACGNVVYYTDTLALAMAASNQSQTIGDYTAVTTLAGLPVSNNSQAIIQGLLAFKLFNVFLITGDVATSNLGANECSTSVGTAAPRSVVSTPDGVKFMANDGIRTINFLGTVSEADPDLAVPFIYAVHPSRVAAAFNSGVYRICTQNGAAAGSPYQDYWYHTNRRAWTGPHTFQYDIAVPLDNDFALASNTIPGSMWDSFVVQSHQGTGVTFVENGVQLVWQYIPAPLSDLGNIYANSWNRATVEISQPASGQTYNFTAQNEGGSALATAQITAATNQAVWGSFTWGLSNWGAAQSGLIPLTIPWDQAVICNKLSIIAGGPSELGFKIGSLHLNAKWLNYFLN